MRLRHLLHKCPCLNHAESASVGKYHCGDKHLSSNYKGICIGLIHDAACNRVCADESSDNSGGICDFLQCWCITKCTSETEVVASAPIQQWYNDPRLNNDPILPSHRLIIIYNTCILGVPTSCLLMLCHGLVGQNKFIFSWANIVDDQNWHVTPLQKGQSRLKKPL
jgi:hypothetical protein